jgi:hypothetical protein
MSSSIGHPKRAMQHRVVSLCHSSSPLADDGIRDGFPRNGNRLEGRARGGIDGDGKA